MADTEGRSTWGGGTGWSEGQSKGEQPSEEATPQDAQENSSTPDAQADSSSEQVSQDQSSEQVTPSTSQPEPEKWNAPPKERWDEVVKQKNEAQELLKLSIEKTQQPQTPVTQPAADPWEGKTNHSDPATAQYYQEQKRLLQYEAQKVAQNSNQSVMQAVNAGRTKLASMEVSQFRKDHPEVVVGSPEDQAMIASVGQGYPLEDARKLAMFDKLETENLAFKGKSQQRSASIPMKQAANNAAPASGVPEQSGLPGNRQTSEDRAGEAYDSSGGDFMTAARAFFTGSK